MVPHTITSIIGDTASITLNLDMNLTTTTILTRTSIMTILFTRPLLMELKRMTTDLLALQKRENYRSLSMCHHITSTTTCHTDTTIQNSITSLTTFTIGILKTIMSTQSLNLSTTDRE